MYTFPHKVQYYETDMMGVVHHANYLHWMEEARIAFMDQLGFPYAQMEASGIISPVKAITCQYLHPCSFGDEIIVRLTVESFNGVILVIRYDMRKGDETVFTAGSEHVFLNKEGRFVRMKKELPEFCDAIEQVIHLSKDEAT